MSTETNNDYNKENKDDSGITTKKGSSKPSLSWIIFAAVSLLSAIAVYFFFHRLIPLVDLKVAVNQEQVLSRARALAGKYNLSPAGYDEAVYFHTDEWVKRYVELMAGGRERFQQLIAEESYHPYTWRVRHYKPGSLHESLLIFTPEGKSYGFVETIAESEPGAALQKEEAVKRIEDFLRDTWSLDISQYELIDTSYQERTSGRIDYTCVFQLKDLKLGEAPYRLSTTLAGDKVTGIWHWIDIPEIAYAQYRQMRSTSEVIQSIGNSFLYLLYLMIFAFFGGLWLLISRRYGGINPLPALAVAGFLGILSLCENLNQLPFVWINYNTSVSPTSTLWHFCLSILTHFLSILCIFILSVFAGEGFSRITFGNHVRLWSFVKRRVFTSHFFAQVVLIGYLSVPIMFLYELIFHAATSRWLSWWFPSSLGVNPNILSTYIPSLSPLAESITAGVWEEFIFRAVPLAVCGYIGKRLGSRTTGVIIGSILQAVVFGFAHANYPNVPGYARVVELFFPSIASGLVYLCWGLVPMMITHFVYDAVLMASPLFISTAPGIWLHRILVLAVIVFPGLLVAISRLLAGQWTSIKEEDLNRSHRAGEVMKKVVQPPEPVQRTDITPAPWLKWLVIAGAGVGLLSIFALSSFRYGTTPITITRDEILVESKELLAKLHPTDDLSRWRLMTRVVPANRASHRDLFVLETVGKKRWNELRGRYLPDAEWRVRAARFDGPLEERASQLIFSFSPDGTLLNTQYEFPESAPGEELSEEAATKIALHRAVTAFGLSRDELEVWQAVSEQLPHRKDWAFTFIHKADKEETTVDKAIKDPQARDQQETQAHDEALQNSLSSQVPRDGMQNSSNLVVGDQQETRAVQEAQEAPVISAESVKRLIHVNMAGDMITTIEPGIYLPQQWQQEFAQKTEYQNSVSLVVGMLRLLFFLLIIGLCIYAWIQRRPLCFSTSLLFVLFYGLVFCGTIYLSLPKAVYDFTTSQSFNLQLFMHFLSRGVDFAIGLVLIFWALLWATRSWAYKTVYGVSRRENFLIGIAVGIGLLAMATLCQAWAVGLPPVRAELDGANALYPLLMIVCGSIVSYTQSVVFAMAFNALVAPLSLGVRYLLLMFVFAVISTPLLNTPIFVWAAIVFVYFVSYVILYRYIFRFMPSTLVYTYATLIITQLGVAAFNNVYPYAWLHYSVASLAVLGVAIFLSRQVSAGKQADKVLLEVEDAQDEHGNN